MLTVPFALLGGIWYMYLLGYNMSVAVMVGFIALIGVAVEIGVVMIIYLDRAFDEKLKDMGELDSEELHEAVLTGAATRVRPIIMTAAAIIGGLLPIMWSTETGSRVMKRIAAPMVGGMVTATILTLFLIPIVYLIWRNWEMRRAVHRGKG